MPKGISKIIAVKATNGQVGEYVTVINLTTGGKMRGQLDANLEVVFNPVKELNADWAEGDSISVYMSGRINDGNTTTINAGGAIVTIDASATGAGSMANISL